MAKDRNNWPIAAIAAMVIAVFTAYGTVLMTLDGRLFEAQASMVTQEQLRFELGQSNERIERRLNSMEAYLLLLLERENEKVQ
jgi:hypothetical protein